MKMITSYGNVYLFSGKESDALIRINYQQVDAEMIPCEGNAVKPQRIASLNFNSINIIGKNIFPFLKQYSSCSNDFSQCWIKWHIFQLSSSLIVLEWPSPCRMFFFFTFFLFFLSFVCSFVPSFVLSLFISLLHYACFSNMFESFLK